MLPLLQLEPVGFCSLYRFLISTTLDWWIFSPKFIACSSSLSVERFQRDILRLWLPINAAELKFHLEGAASAEDVLT